MLYSLKMKFGSDPGFLYFLKMRIIAMFLLGRTELETSCMLNKSSADYPVFPAPRMEF